MRNARNIRLRIPNSQFQILNCLIPHYLVGRQHRSREARANVMEAAVFSTHWHDAAIAAAHPAAHDPFDRHLTGPAAADSKTRGRREHPLPPAKAFADRVARGSNGGARGAIAASTRRGLPDRCRDRPDVARNLIEHRRNAERERRLEVRQVRAMRYQRLSSVGFVGSAVMFSTAQW